MIYVLSILPLISTDPRASMKRFVSYKKVYLTHIKSINILILSHSIAADTLLSHTLNTSLALEDAHRRT